MKTPAVIIALFAASSIAAVAVPPSRVVQVKPRQETVVVEAPPATSSIVVVDVEAEVEAVLADARAKSIATIRNGGGEGRRLFECGQLCSQCRTGAVTAAVAEIALCGTAALAVEVFTLGTATILEVAGFIACEAAAIGTLNEAEANCQGLADPANRR
ncbi:hypothetical protein QQZ08_012407 [Neonectria magnoliae]|uniref:Uncharacterized protein n=1 Tax=Neonectria magnoliae TaxID=2732573 RepID=A0ABR1H2R4_9HYPO